MAKGAQLISSPEAILPLLNVIENFIKNESVIEDLEAGMKLLWSSVIYFNRLSVVAEASDYEIASLQPRANDILNFLLQFLETLFLPRFAAIWPELYNTYSSNPPEIVDTLAAMLQILLTKDQNIIHIARGKNYLAGFKYSAVLPPWNERYHWR